MIANNLQRIRHGLATHVHTRIQLPTIQSGGPVYAPFGRRCAALLLGLIVLLGLAFSACSDSEPEPSWAATERAFWAYIAEHYRASLGAAEIADAISAVQEGMLDGQADDVIALFWISVGQRLDYLEQLGGAAGEAFWIVGKAAAWQRYRWLLSDAEQLSILARPDVDLDLYVGLTNAEREQYGDELLAANPELAP